MGGGSEHFDTNDVKSLDKIQSGFTKYDLSTFMTFFQLNTHIDALIRLNQIEEAKEVVARAFVMTEGLGARFLLPETLRLDAICNLKQKTPDPAKAESKFLQSIELARSQKCKLWELRCATSLARFWGEHGDRQKAYDLLFPIYDWYTEGFDTFDLKEGKSLLQELQ